MSRPKKSSVPAGLEKAADEFEKFEDDVKRLTQDKMNEAPLLEEEPQTNLSQKEIEKSKEIYLKPERHIGDGQKFNPRFKKQWEEAKEYVQFIAQNREIGGEAIELWTHPFGGVGGQFWRVPVNKPVWGPRHLAEQIRRCQYHILIMDQTKQTYGDSMGAIYGSIAVEQTVNRLNAEPVSTSKSVFMSAGNF